MNDKAEDTAHKSIYITSKGLLVASSTAAPDKQWDSILSRYWR